MRVAVECSIPKAWAPPDREDGVKVSSRLAEDLMPPEVSSTATWATLLVDYANVKCVLQLDALSPKRGLLRTARIG